MNDPQRRVRFGKYVVKALIGEGSMAHVYRAHDASLERDVAIKTLKEHLLLDDDNAEEIIGRFGREARIVGKLQHEHFVSVFEYVDEWDPPFMVMELVEGKTLAQLLREDYPFRPGEVVHIVLQMLSALGYAHGQGVIHRDVKSQNIFLLPGPKIKITDFGIAQIRSSTLTQVGSVMGTAAYMSPEQFRGEVVDHRTDLWSVGIVLFELLAGKRPFRGGADTVREKVLNAEPAFELSEPKRRIADEFEPVIRKALAKAPDERYQSAAEFSLGLAEAAQEYHSGATQPPQKATVQRAQTESLTAKTVRPSRVSGVAQVSSESKPMSSWAPAILRAIRSKFSIITACAAMMLAVLMFWIVPAMPNEPWIAARIQQARCAVLEHEMRDNDVVIRGVAGDRGQLEALRSDLEAYTHGRTRSEVILTSERQCPVLAFVSTLKRQGRLTSQAMMLDAGAGLLSQGTLLDLTINGPAFHSYVGLDFIDANGGVTHLIPDRELGSIQLASNATKSLREVAGAAINYEIACPCGQELIVGIASASPDMFAALEESEPLDAYLANLRQSIDAMPEGTLLSMHVVPITSVGR